MSAHSCLSVLLSLLHIVYICTVLFEQINDDEDDDDDIRNKHNTRTGGARKLTAGRSQCWQMQSGGEASDSSPCSTSDLSECP